MQKKEDTLIVSISGDILLVGRKLPGESVDIVNAFQGEDAKKIYKMLTEKPAVNNDAEVSE